MKRAIFTLLTITLTLVNMVHLTASETAIPYLTQLADFNGVEVTDLETFSPSSAGVDHTLEVQATVGTKINVAGMYEYTPTESGKVRFVQKGTLVYVYENDMYVTNLIPEAPITFPDLLTTEGDNGPDWSNSGIYDQANLFKDPGFEYYKGDNNDGDNSSRWIPIDWILADYVPESFVFTNSRVNFSPSGGDFGSTLSNEIEGFGVFMLHSHSASDYFAQEIPTSTMKADTYYQIKFSAWSHSHGGSGGGNFVIKVGTEINEGDIYSFDFSLPGTRNTSMIVSCFFLMDESNNEAPVYVTIAHKSDTNRRLGHFDRMTLVEATDIAPVGITGVSAASYLQGEAYAPDFELPANTYFDITSYITNPDFDLGTAGWTTTTGASARGTFVAETKGDIPSEEGVGYGDFIGNVWENWNSSNITGKMYQKISGLPNGKYLLKATVMANRTWEAGRPGEQEEEWLVLYANDSESYVDQPRHIKTYAVESLVSDGTLEIGINIKQDVANWFAIDNFRLSFYGFDFDAAKVNLQKLVEEAMAISEVKMDKDSKLQLMGLIESANAVIDNSAVAKSVLEATTEQILTAIAASWSSIEGYSALQTAINKANENKTNYTSLPGYSEFESAIGVANDIYTLGEATISEVLEAIEALYDAEIVCRLTDLVPFDATFAIKNPSFEDNSSVFTNESGRSYTLPAYWNLGLLPLTASGYDIKMSTTSVDGTYGYNIWGTFQELDLNQEIKLIPGSYTLTAKMYGEEGKVGEPQAVYVTFDRGETKKYSDNYTYVEPDGNNSQWVPLSVNFEVTEETESIRIGVHSVGTGTDVTGWFRIDDFRLEATIGSSVNRVETENLLVHGVQGGVYVTSKDKVDVSIVSITGQLIKTLKVEGQKLISLPSGVYIINGVKTIVR